MVNQTQGFLPLQIQSSPDQPHRFVYVKQHLSETAKDLNSNSSFFVTGLPTCQEDLEYALLAGFSALGPVESVVIHPSQASALVCLKDSCAWKNIQQAARDGLTVPLSSPPGKNFIGLRGWVEEHKRAFQAPAALRQQLDDWMTQHEAEEAAKKQATDNDDGWTVVRRKGGRRKTTDSAGTAVGVVGRAAAEARLKSRKEPKVLNNFYKFQRRNKRRSEIMELQEKFEKDKHRISELKAARRFKPY